MKFIWANESFYFSCSVASIIDLDRFESWNQEYQQDDAEGS
jgi:hypothetical protein